MTIYLKSLGNSYIFLFLNVNPNKAGLSEGFSWGGGDQFDQQLQSKVIIPKVRLEV